MKFYPKRYFFFCFLLLFACGCTEWDEIPLAKPGMTPSAKQTPSIRFSTPVITWEGNNAGEVSLQTEDSVSIASEEYNGIEYSIRKANAHPDKAILELSVLDIERRMEKCKDGDGSFNIEIKLPAPLVPGYTVAAFMPQPSLFDSLKVTVENSELIKIKLYEKKNISYFQNLAIKLFIDNGGGLPLPPVTDFIDAIDGDCGGVEIVLLENMLTLPIVTKYPASSLFMTMTEHFDGELVDESSAWYLIEHMWYEEEILGTVTMPKLVRVACYRDSLNLKEM